MTSDNYIVGNSWVYMLIKKYLSNIISDDDMLELVVLRENDIDVYHGLFTTTDNNEDK